MDNLKKVLKIDDTLLKVPKKEKPTKINDVVTMMDGFNYMADILYLPETKEGFKYLLVITDLATREFDIEPLKSKTTDEVLTAMKAMFKRKYISIPKASLRTDNGTEFNDLETAAGHDVGAGRERHVGVAADVDAAVVGAGLQGDRRGDGAWCR